MSEVLSIEQLKKLALITIDIPDFENKGTIKVRVQKPRLMKMAAEGKIPNSLMSTAMEMTGYDTGESKKDSKVDLTKIAGMLELYCKTCLVEPTYEEFKDIMTDEQMMAIFDWATGDLIKMSNFREDEEDGTGNNDGKDVSNKTKRIDGNR